MKQSLLYILTFLFATSCVSATLEDDISVKKNVDFSSQLNVPEIATYKALFTATSVTPSPAMLQAGCAVVKSTIPSATYDATTNKCNVVLTQTKDVDVSKDLDKITSKVSGVSYSLSDVVLDITPIDTHVNSISVALGDTVLVDNYITSHEVQNANLIQGILSAGPTTIKVDVNVTLDKDIVITASYDVGLSLHFAATLDKTL